MKIALGTVQFGMKYGIANQGSCVPLNEITEILHEAFVSGMDTLDTAISYGNSEETLGKVGVGSWNIVGKLPAVSAEITNILYWAREQLLSSLSNLRVTQLHGLLLHRPAQLLSPIGKDLYLALLALKEEGLTRKIGISVYDPLELDQIFADYDFDLVQLPLNILDRRMLDSGWIARLNDAGVEVHGRSIFLQGLLLMDHELRPKKFERWSQIWNEWDRWLAVSGLTPLEACLRYSLSLQGIDRLVVGVDSLKQFKEILSVPRSPLPFMPDFSNTVDPVLINPSMWSGI